MKLALFEGQRHAPAPGLQGQCPSCGAPVTAKCGNYKIWHWAHKTREHCDPWWESEGEWHRGWKDRFPQEWQEIPHQSSTGERHVADIRTPAGLIIEFQRSTIHPDEVLARQNYYGKMIWVIDGCKNEFDPINFSNWRGRPDEHGLAQFAVFGRSKLFERWHTEKPVFIDFGKAGFWRIAHYNPKTKRGVALIVNKEAFVQMASSGSTDFSAQGGPASPL
ncbi:competence protein CoiA [Pseudomonas syringae group genomosp. 3]|uniref:competence protein CoiA n=1 Tax=Pseudomonas syringae group genomosp. 3 TaxID=251701 RepID=UPI0005C9262E|nr:competence protein CoiA family protein [Pseudomonas syringae group genomosp. 3]